MFIHEAEHVNVNNFFFWSNLNIFWWHQMSNGEKKNEISIWCVCKSFTLAPLAKFCVSEQTGWQLLPTKINQLNDSIFSLANKFAFSQHSGEWERLLHKVKSCFILSIFISCHKD